MENLEKLFQKDSEIYDIFKHFKQIENIYEKSLLAMGYRPYNNISSNSSNFYLPNLEINSNKEG